MSQPTLLFILIILVIILIILIIYCFKKKKKNKEQFKLKSKLKSNIWMYWENKPNKEKPVYLDLCLDTVYKHCSNDFNIHLLNENTVYDYIPNLRRDINHLNIPQKTDYIRLLLLYKYGGIWLDSDIIVMKSLYPIIEKLKKHEYVGFGCHYNNCKNSGYPKPANWVMASRKNGILMKKCINKCHQILDKLNNKTINLKSNYFILGRELIWKEIAKCKKNIKGWDYYHFDSKGLDRDSNYNKIRNTRLLSNENVDKNCSMFVPIYNTNPGFPESFLNLSKEELLNSNMLISKLFRESLY